MLRELVENCFFAMISRFYSICFSVRTFPNAMSAMETLEPINTDESKNQFLSETEKYLFTELSEIGSEMQLVLQSRKHSQVLSALCG